MPKNKDLRKRVSDTIETRWAENARVTQLLKDKLSQSLDNVSMIGNKLKTIKITIPAKHYYYNVSHIQPRKDHEADEYVLFDDKEQVMSCTDDSYIDKFSTYILNNINEELEMSSIYEQMNKIDDNKSLNEKWNVKNQRKLKKLKENFTVRQYALDWDGEYDCAEEESFDTMDEAQIRFDELKEMIDNGEFDYAAVALVDENDNEISIYGEPERQKITKEDVIKYLRDKEKVRLTDQEFDYVVEDLWDAISWEMREGAIYETIDDVDMVELIDAADNPTHDLCYKLMGLLDDEKLE